MASESDAALLLTEVHYLESEAAGAEYKLLIGKRGLKDDTPPVVVFLPDADLNFGGAMNSLWGLQVPGWVPPILLVGIGYRVTQESETYTLRARDFTPSVDPAAVKKWGWETGGADRFLGFIQDQLKPWLADHYAVDPEENAYFGDSLGGLFGAYVLLTAPGTFKRYGLGSASLWYDRGSTFVLESAYAETHDDLAAKVFLSVGGHEDLEGDQMLLDWEPAEKRAEAAAAAAEDEAAFGVIDMVADQERFVALLRSRNYPGLIVESEVLPGEFHMTSPLLNFSRSMRFLFGAPR